MSWMKSVFSSMASEVGWDDETNEVIVVWPNGKTSAYGPATEDVAVSVANAPSVGQAINSELKGQYGHRYR